MPLYDYAPKSGKCTICKGRFEVHQRIAEPKLKRCPTCKMPVERLVGAPMVKQNQEDSEPDPAQSVIPPNLLT